MSLALRGAIGFGIASLIALVGFEALDRPHSYKFLVAIIGFAVSGAIGGAVLALGRKSPKYSLIAAIFIAAIGFSIGFVISNVVIVLFSIAIRDAVGVSVLWAMGFGFAGMIGAPSLCLGLKQITFRSLLYLVITGGVGFGIAGAIGGAIAISFPEFKAGMFTGMLIAYTLGGAWVGAAVSRLETEVTDRERKEPAEIEAPAGRSGLAVAAQEAAVREGEEPTKIIGPAKRDGIAVAAAVLGMLAMIFALAFPARFRLPLHEFLGRFDIPTLTALLLATCGLPPLILGVDSLVRIKKSQGKLSGGAWALAGVTCGAILLLSSSFLLVGPIPRYFDRHYALALLESVRGQEADWNYGNVIFEANSRLGRISLKEGKIEDAKRYLLEAGKTPGSPQLDSFGPDMTLAKELLEQGERQAVIEYLDLCAKFWKGRSARLASWKSIVEAGGMPNFSESGPLPEGRWTLRVPQAWRSEEIEAYGPEGTALRRPEPGRKWLELLIEVAAPSASAGLAFGEVAVVDEAGASHPAVAIAGPAPEGLSRPRFLFLEEAFKPWQDPIRPSSRSTWLYSYEGGQRSQISYMGSDRGRVFGITRAGRVKILSEQPARMFLLFAPPAEAKQFELRLGERERAAVNRISTPDWTSAAFAPRAGRSAEDRKKDEERRKAQIAGWAQACDAGGVQACYGLGSHYRSGKEFGEAMPKDHLARAAAAFQKACDRGSAAGLASTKGEVAVACNTLGDMVREGQGVPADLARAVAFYKKGCEAQDLSDFKYRACWSFAKHGPEELDRAFTGYEKACDARDAAACYTLGTLYSGTLGSVANRLGEGSSHVRADALFEKACDGGNAMACYTFGRRKNAVSSLQKACDRGIHRACTDLGGMYQAGKGVRKDEARAAALRKKGELLRDKENCEGGLLEHCASVAAAHESGTGVPKDLARSAALLQKACDAGELSDCVALGIMYERGTGVPKDLARAAALYKQACDERHIGGCRNLGIMYRDGLGVPKDPVRAVALFKQVCEQFYRTCVELGYMYQHGQGVSQDLARAADLYKKGCDGGDEWGCASLGWMYLTGTGFSKDEARAVTLFRQACRGGSDYACQQLKQARR